MKKKIDSIMNFMINVTGLYFRFDKNVANVGKELLVIPMFMNILTIFELSIHCFRYFNFIDTFVQNHFMAIFIGMVVLAMIISIFIKDTYLKKLEYKELKLGWYFYVLPIVYLFGSGFLFLFFIRYMSFALSFS